VHAQDSGLAIMLMDFMLMTCMPRPPPTVNVLTLAARPDPVHITLLS
jgi:hypothetical protein